MAIAPDPSQAFSLPPGEVPLGIQRPLGQSMLQPTFMTPLGTQSLTVLDPAVFLAQQAPKPDLQADFQDSPFFDPPNLAETAASLSMPAAPDHRAPGREPAPVSNPPAIQPAPQSRSRESTQASAAPQLSIPQSPTPTGTDSTSDISEFSLETDIDPADTHADISAEANDSATGESPPAIAAVTESRSESPAIAPVRQTSQQSSNQSSNQSGNSSTRSAIANSLSDEPTGSQPPIPAIQASPAPTTLPVVEGLPNEAPSSEPTTPDPVEQAASTIAEAAIVQPAPSTSATPPLETVAPTSTAGTASPITESAIAPSSPPASTTPSPGEPLPGDVVAQGVTETPEPTIARFTDAEALANEWVDQSFNPPANNLATPTIESPTGEAQATEPIGDSETATVNSPVLDSSSPSGSTIPTPESSQSTNIPIAAPTPTTTPSTPTISESPAPAIARSVEEAPEITDSAAPVIQASPTASNESAAPITLPSAESTFAAAIAQPGDSQPTSSSTESNFAAAIAQPGDSQPTSSSTESNFAAAIAQPGDSQPTDTTSSPITPTVIEPVTTTPESVTSRFTDSNTDSTTDSQPSVASSASSDSITQTPEPTISRLPDESITQTPEPTISRFTDSQPVATDLEQNKPLTQANQSLETGSEDAEAITQTIELTQTVEPTVAKGSEDTEAITQTVEPTVSRRANDQTISNQSTSSQVTSNQVINDQVTSNQVINDQASNNPSINNQLLEPASTTSIPAIASEISNADSQTVASRESSDHREDSSGLDTPPMLLEERLNSPDVSKDIGEPPTEVRQDAIAEGSDSTLPASEIAPSTSAPATPSESITARSEPAIARLTDPPSSDHPLIDQPLVDDSSTPPTPSDSASSDFTSTDSGLGSEANQQLLDSPTDAAIAPADATIHRFTADSPNPDIAQPERETGDRAIEMPTHSFEAAETQSSEFQSSEFQSSESRPSEFQPSEPKPLESSQGNSFASDIDSVTVPDHSPTGNFTDGTSIQKASIDDTQTENFDISETNIENSLKPSYQEQANQENTNLETSNSTQISADPVSPDPVSPDPVSAASVSPDLVSLDSASSGSVSADSVSADSVSADSVSAERTHLAKADLESSVSDSSNVDDFISSSTNIDSTNANGTNGSSITDSSIAAPQIQPRSHDPSTLPTTPSLETLSLETPSLETSSLETSSLETPPLETPSLETPAPTTNRFLETGDRTSASSPPELPEVSSTLPQLPTVLQPLSIWEPLIQTQSLITTPPSLIQPEQPIPATAIVNVAGQSPPSLQTARLEQSVSASEAYAAVLPDISSQSSDRAVEQPTIRRTTSLEPGTIRKEVATNGWSNLAELYESTLTSDNAAPPEIATEASEQPNGYSDLLESESRAAIASAPTDIIQRESTPTTSDTTTTTTTTTTDAPISEPAKPKASPEQLERLAQEIYRLVRQRLALDRERGGHSYSGRLF